MYQVFCVFDAEDPVPMHYRARYARSILALGGVMSMGLAGIGRAEDAQTGPSPDMATVVTANQARPLTLAEAAKEALTWHPSITEAASATLTQIEASKRRWTSNLAYLLNRNTQPAAVAPDVPDYRVFVQTKVDSLTNKTGRTIPITPGMDATVDVHIGSKTVLQYLLKPLDRAHEALRDR
jgi:hypothetical protein